MLFIRTIINYPKKTKKRAMSGLRKNANPIGRATIAEKMEMGICTQPSCVQKAIPGMKSCQGCLDKRAKYHDNKRKEKNGGSVRLHGREQPQGSSSGEAPRGGEAAPGGLQDDPRRAA